MAIVKHIKSRNANYSAAINYLLFEHDEKTGKKIVDESGRSILRKEFYMDGLNCDPMSFDKECELTNAHFHKNKKREDIKSHHYIISYDPADVTENGLTGERAQAISLELAKQMFPGYQALVVTHTNGHNESGNIHTHKEFDELRFAVDDDGTNILVLINKGEIAGAVDIDNMYEFASSHCTDFKDLRDDEDIVINREWILNKLAEAENE